MQFSNFGEKFTRDAGILTLMEDLGNALTVNKEMLMLGGGNPGMVPGVVAKVQERLKIIASDPESVFRFLGIYDPPQGHQAFIAALVKYFRNHYGWQIREENICLTNGSQSAFFMLYNLLAGEFKDGSFKQILFPLTPEYIGYADTGIHEGLFTANRPSIEMLEPPFFKYHIDFDKLIVSDHIAAIAVSRPTNPTGNVLTDEEIHKLDAIAREKKIPLIIDNAYGLPFPQIVYSEAQPFWNEHTILCMSLSKLGFPAIRTGIVIGPAEITQALAKMNAILSLSPVGAGAALVTEWIESGEIETISHTLVRPFYEEKMKRAVSWIKTYFTGFDYAIHQPEGAMFLWLWFKDLPISNQELYERLKQNGTLVVSGQYFFPGLKEPWEHTGQCIRMTYSQSDEVVKQGIMKIAEEVIKIVA